MNMAKLSKAERAAIDREACALWDKLNPEPDVKINVSKDECIKRVMKLKREG